MYVYMISKNTLADGSRAGEVGYIQIKELNLSEVGNGNPLQYSCLRNPMDRGAWWATVHSIAKESDTTQ